MESNKAKKQQLLDALYKPYQNCTACPLGTQGRTNVVFGEGNPNATILFIGEAPGRDEDLQGRPFVGRSGQLLNQALQAAGIERSDVFITNIVKCRPPGNRNPLPIESSTCKNLLLFNQIKIIQPRIIATLGACALQLIIKTDTPGFKISHVRGKPIKRNNTIIVPIFHPAYVLRNRNMSEIFFNDIALLKKLAA